MEYAETEGMGAGAFPSPLPVNGNPPETPRAQTEEFHNGKIYCANCIHCKLIPGEAEKESSVLRIRCSAGKWKKKQGEEKFYKYCTVTRRRGDFCDAYEEMGDSREFMRELRENLSGKNGLFPGLPEADDDDDED
jgi:hypothetical protein